MLVPRLGQRVVEFSLPDQAGQTRSLSEFLRSGSVIVNFFPFAFSGVCDKEMCTFRDDLNKLASQFTGVVAISVDSVFTLKIFAHTYGLQFPLLSDFNKKVTKLYGVLQDPWAAYGYKGVAKRSVFLVDRRGFLRYRWIGEDPSVEPPYEELMSAIVKLSK
jgi:peroxiredoxin